MTQFDYTTLAGQFESYLAAHQPYGTPDSLYEPIRYINDLGGKRIRPVLLLMAYNLWHEDVTPALPAALAVEYFHNFSLMHDDVMDQAPLRRGKETVHRKYSLSHAILSGDALLIRCFHLLLEAGKDKGIGAELCSVMSKAALEICEGQQMDMDFESMLTPTEPEYLEMIRKKTACLIGVSLQIGATLAGAGLQDREALYHFGETIGMGFQVQDDILDVFGDSSQTGKQTGGDILRGKKNYLYVNACNTLSPREQEIFEQTYIQAARNQDISEVIKFYERLNVMTSARKIKSELFQKGMDLIQTIPEVNISALEQFSNELMLREK